MPVPSFFGASENFPDLQQDYWKRRLASRSEGLSYPHPATCTWHMGEAGNGRRGLRLAGLTRPAPGSLGVVILFG